MASVSWRLLGRWGTISRFVPPCFGTEGTVVNVDGGSAINPVDIYTSADGHRVVGVIAAVSTLRLCGD